MDEPSPPQFQQRPPRPQQTYKFSADEMRIIKECNREAFYQRCIPLCSLLGFSTYYGVQAGFLKPNARYGAIPKVAVSVVAGYFLGKLSYQSKCAEKIMQLPNSQLAEILRKRRQGKMQESLDSSFCPSMSLGPFSGISSSDTYSDIMPQNSLDLDTSRPQYEGLDDSLRPSMDNPIYEEEMPPVQQHTTTYEELRKKNREEYKQKRVSASVLPNREYSPSAAPSQSIPSTGPELPKNKYGDIWG